MTDKVQVEAARRSLRKLLGEIFGPGLQGVNGFGVAFDRTARDLVINVHLDPGVAPEVRDQIPARVDDVRVMVETVGVAHLQ